MANSSKDPSKKRGTPKGVRGPGGPTGGPASGGRPGGAPASRSGSPTGSGWRATLERLSLPLLTALHAVPRWLVVVLPAALLLGGLVLKDSWAWLGGLLLTVVWLFLTWLTALSWPALSPGSRFFRGLIVAFFAAIVVLKFRGSF